MRRKVGTSQTADPIRLTSKLRARSLLTAGAPSVVVENMHAMSAVHKNMSALTGNPGISRALVSPPRIHSGIDTANTAKKNVHGKPGQVRLFSIAGVSGMGLDTLLAKKVGKCGWSPKDDDNKSEHNDD